MYQMNEGTLAIPADWRDESLHVFVLPGDAINLVVNRTPIDFGLTAETVYQQTLAQFAAHLKGYEERGVWTLTLDGQPAHGLEYTWRSPEGPMHQVVVMQLRGELLMTFTVTVAGELSAEQKTAMLAVVETFKAAT
ncbi:hypothetical protein F157LOC_03227 [Pectobacterium brasiliense]|uniref:DUF1795 domain-containing protein n=1 Tax=Pectobacterium brasiliense TaxID=180957 RepID=UPI000CE697D3|nr:DUF1795 domain-containing protein [Pectobacterium brasiliense]PPE58206.1 hypothetical protein F157LOC_03227 [Pectobacterium brasiliense]